MGSPVTGLEKTNRPQSTMVKLAPTSRWTCHPLPDAMLGHFKQREGPPWGQAGAGATEARVWLRTSSSWVGFLVPSSLRQGVLGNHGATFKGPVELCPADWPTVICIALGTCGQPGCLCTTLTAGVLEPIGGSERHLWSVIVGRQTTDLEVTKRSAH